MQSWKESKPCADCHFFYRYFQMEFDHEPIRGVKSFNLGTQGKFLDEITLRREMAKCQVVCCNDHAFRTWHRLCGLGLSTALPRKRLGQLPAGASLTPWTNVDTATGREGLSGRSPHGQNGRSPKNLPPSPLVRVRSGSGYKYKTTSHRIFR